MESSGILARSLEENKSSELVRRLGAHLEVRLCVRLKGAIPTAARRGCVNVVAYYHSNCVLDAHGRQAWEAHAISFNSRAP